MGACYGGTDVMERSCAVARGKDINKWYWTNGSESREDRLASVFFQSQTCFGFLPTHAGSRNWAQTPKIIFYS
jgi:hypothetical protein